MVWQKTVERKKIEKDLGLTSDEIKEFIRQVQVTEKKLRDMEVDFVTTVDEILGKG